MPYIVSGTPVPFETILPKIIQYGGDTPNDGVWVYCRRRTPLPRLEWASYLRPISFSIGGMLKPDLASAKPVLKEIIRSAPDISPLGGLMIWVTFQDRWFQDTKDKPHVSIRAQLNRNICNGSYCGFAGAPEIPEHGWNHAEAFAQAGFFQKIGPRQYASPYGSEHTVNTMGLSSFLERMGEEQIDQLYDYLSRASTGEIFKIDWSASTTDALARENSWRVYDLVAGRNFPAEEYLINIQCRLLDWRSIEVQRQWIGDGTEFNVLLRTFTTCLRRKAGFVVHIGAEGFRFAVMSNRPLEEKELLPLEEQLGLTFDRTPYRPRFPK